MLRPWWYATQGAINVPAGLILAAKDGIDLGTDWSVWTAANGKFLRGTDSDSVVGTSGGRYGLSTNTTYNGGHVGWLGSLANHIKDTGMYGRAPTSSGRSPCDDPNPQGNHRHSVSVSYRPQYVHTRLIQAQNKAPVPIGAIMFGTAENNKQALWTYGNGYFFYANPSVSRGGVAQSASIVYANDYHDHLLSLTQQAVSTATMPTTYGAAGSGPGGNHYHYTSLNVSASIGYCALRAFDILDQKSIKGLIGMWAQAGIPDKWELVASMTNRFLYLTSTGTGAVAGSNVVSFSGTTDERGHSHPHTGSSYGVGSGMPHYTTAYHYHTFSRSGAPYLPERYHIKFIRYVG